VTRAWYNARMAPPSKPSRPRGVISLGAPGSGKSTHAARLAERLGAAHVNLGASFRALAQEDSPRGREAREAVAAGRLLPDEVAERVVHDQLAALPAGQWFVLDGYPRTVAQAGGLRRLLADLGRLKPRPVAVRLDVPRDELVRRLTRRRDLEGRSDDTDETIARRLDADEVEGPPLLAALAEYADVVHVDGDRPAEDVTDEVLERLRRPG